jgi:GDP-mannose 6-dehydrogenase
MISFIGLGHVGTVMAASLASRGRRVIAFDCDASKVDALRAGRASVVEPGLDMLVADSVASGRLRATADLAEAITSSTVSIVCVGTPSSPDGSIDLSQLVAAFESIGQVLSGLRRYHLIIIRSTALPGTTSKVAIPLMEHVSGRSATRDFGVCYSPEFVREGEAIRDFHDPPKVVIGERATQDGDIALELFPHSATTAVIRTDFETAEMLKYIDNSWHALKVGFANEIGSLAKALGLDGRKLMAEFERDTTLNISPAYLVPGAPYGGSCLPKDLAAIRSLASESKVDVPLLDAVMASNLAHQDRLLQLVGKDTNKRIGIVGAGFKAGSGDIRGSPYVGLAESLTRLGHAVRIYDRHLEPTSSAVHSSSDGQVVPHLAASIRELVEFADVLVLCHLDQRYVEELRRSMTPTQLLVDLVGAGREASGAASYTGICW